MPAKSLLCPRVFAMQGDVTRVLTLGQAKLIIRFLFQGFQNSMRQGGHFSLFIMTKILRKKFKKPHQCNNEICEYLKIHAVQIAI